MADIIEAVQYLFEIGTEELPAGSMEELRLQLEGSFEANLREHGLPAGELKSYATPRRLAVYVGGLSEGTESKTEIVKGPPVGSPQEAQVGFARRHGLSPDQLESQDGRLIARKTVASRPAREIIPTIVKRSLADLDGERTMRWGEGEHRFARPVRWLVSMGVSIEAFGLVSGEESRGSRLHGETIPLGAAGDYRERLLEAGVEPDPMARQASIYEQAKELERIHDIRVELVPELVREVRDLTEYPRLLLASFEKRFLELPEFLVTTVLRSHQRCFPCFDRTGKLLPLFAFAASCLPEADDTVINGNRRVVRARLRDCEFFLASDRKRPLEAYLPELEAMTFQRELGDAGSIGAKAARLVRLAQQLELPEELTEAARLCKCDLATQTVFEFPELQGQVGAYLSGLEAIREHYLPLQLKGELPSSQAGAWLSVLDRADTIVALFSAGKVPSGSSDPYALRRQTLGMFSVLSEFRLDIAPKRILEMAASHLPDTQMEPLWSSGGLGEFCRQRLVYVLSYAYPRWSLDMLLHDVTCLERAVPTMLAELDSLLSCPQEDLESLVTAMQRLRRILKKQPLPGEIGELKEPAERRLWQVLEQLREEMPGHSMKWQLAAQVSQPVHEFFEQCLVEDPDDPGASASRKAMLGQLLETISHNLRYPDWDAW